MTLRIKLLMAQLPLIAALFFLGVFSMVTTSRIGDSSQIILQDNYRSVLAVQKMKESLERMDSASLFVMEGLRGEAEKIFAEHRSKFEAELVIQSGNITEKGERNATDALNDSWFMYRKKQDEFLGLRNRSREKTFYFKELYPLFQSIKSNADRILAMNQDAMVFKSALVNKKAKNMNIVLVTASALFIAAGIIISALLTAWIIRPIAILSQTAQRIGEGDLGVRAKVKGTDEIASLATDFNKMTESLAKYRRSSLGELILSQQSSQAAIDSFDDPVFVFSAEGNLLMANSSAGTIFSTNFSSPQKNLFDGIPTVARDAIEKIRGHIFTGKGRYNPKGFDESFKATTTKGELVFLARGAPVYEMEGAITGAVIILQDITKMTRFSELGHDLVATVAHELRTPLTSLRMAIYICLERSVGELNEKQLDLLYAARDDCDRIQTMVDELLDISRMSAGKITLELRPVGSEELLKVVKDQFINLGKEQGIQFNFSDLAKGEMVHADYERILMVLNNLITNALRHTSAGGTIEVRSIPETDAIRFEVIDSGTGIPEKDLPHIFERFFKGTTNLQGSVGLGLSIVKSIVTAHGGKVGVESAEGEGSTFWFTIKKYQPGAYIVSRTP